MIEEDQIMKKSLEYLYKSLSYDSGYIKTISIYHI